VAPDAAEQLKMRHGVGSLRTMQQLDVDWTPRGIARLQRQAREGALVRDVPRAIAGARFAQTLSHVRDILSVSAQGLHFHAGVVITGGASKMPGVEEVARELLQLDVRCGNVLGVEGFPAISDRTSSAAIGLVRYCGLRARSGAPPRPRRNQPRQVPASHFPWPEAGRDRSGAEGGRQWGRVMRDWMRGFIPARTDA
jgi:cell division ATPase FtsA